MSEANRKETSQAFSQFVTQALKHSGGISLDRHKVISNIFQFQRVLLLITKGSFTACPSEAASKSDALFDFRAHWIQGMVVDIGYFVLLCLLSGVLA